MLGLHIFSSVPKWFFSESVAEPLTHHAVLTDVGMIQTTSLEEDLRATVDRLDDFFPPSEELVDRLASRLQSSGCRAVLCDIAPLGIVAARRAGIPSILLESFTWDFIYEGYLDEWPQLEPHVAWMSEVFSSADLRIQCRPVCRRVPEAATVTPVARAPQHPADVTRRRLQIPANTVMVLVTMGGIPWCYRWLDRLVTHHHAYFVVPGSGERTHREGHLLTMPHRSGLYHPDLVAAADVVVAKLGYSTVAEVHNGDAKLIYVPRARFPESPTLGRWAERHLGAIRLPEGHFESGDWLTDLEGVVGHHSRKSRTPPGGANDAAKLVASVLQSERQLHKKSTPE